MTAAEIQLLVYKEEVKRLGPEVEGQVNTVAEKLREIIASYEENGIGDLAVSLLFAETAVKLEKIKGEGGA